MKSAKTIVNHVILNKGDVKILKELLSQLFFCIPKTKLHKKERELIKWLLLTL